MRFLGLTINQWSEIGLSFLLVLVVVVIGRWLTMLVLERLADRLTGKTRTTLDDAIVDSIRTPLYLTAVVVALEIAVDRLDFIPITWEQPLEDLFFVFYLLVGLIFALRFTANLFRWYGREMTERTETPLDEQLVPFFRRVALIILGLIGLIILLGHFGVNVSALITTLGVGSLAIALAAQAALADTISGFIIMIDRPFRLGDRIELLDLDTWGDVVDVGLRSSRIRTRDNRMVIIPNSVIGKSLIVNHAYPDSQYRIQIHIGVAYGTDIELARGTLIKAVEGVEGVSPDRGVEALFLEFGDSALVFRLRWWINSYVDTRRMFDKVNTAVYKALSEAGIEIPYPQRDVHHKFDPSQTKELASVLRGD